MWVRRAADAVEFLTVRARDGSVRPGKSITRPLMEAEEAVRACREALERACSEAIDAAARDALGTGWVGAVQCVALQAATLIEHVRAVGRSRRWCVPSPSLDGTLRCTGLVPYWLPSGQPNDVHLAPGEPVLLSGPNGSGKSTLLRAMGAATLLGQAGLMVPCAHASVPALRHVFVRAGGLDSPLERRSALENEIYHMTTMLKSVGPAIVLVDEPCRTTSTSDGVPSCAPSCTTSRRTA